ncbi:MAG TPA: nuclear transport factor 2 family protein [Polyangiaceae bacterium]|jgi:steroid delta-isomerase-like uncharacterized protein|nr:nuclear transport factor 2 family protein [Polyangiaceae bacterium]
MTTRDRSAHSADANRLATTFFESLNRGDVDAALSLFSSSAAFEIVPAALRGTAENTGRYFLSALLTAFPDLLMQIRSLMTTPNLAVVELKMEGTQAAEFLGVLNQEKHLDLDQAWMLWVNDDKITDLRAYWCQNQLYRRLAVKRLDRISILG